MKALKTFRLQEVAWPEFGEGSLPAVPPAEEFENRLNELTAAMEREDLTHLVVYADRECFANLAYLTNFDPRFEEALLIMNRTGSPLLLTGNECEARLPVSPLYTAGKLRAERYQSLSLLDQPRERSRMLKDIFSDEGINKTSRIGCVGHKYYSDHEHPDGKHAIDIPAFIVDTLRDLAGRPQVTNATALLMHPGFGCRTTCSASEIAFFEYSNVLGSEGMKRVIFGLEDGILDFELAKKYEFNGMPLNCHGTMTTGTSRGKGLSSPSSNIIRKGEPFSSNIGYWGSNICRAGWVVHNDGELPAEARGYAENFAGPYFAAVAGWYSNLKLGTAGGALYRHIHDQLPDDIFGIYLNAGHLIHYDEWVSSPVYKDSKLGLRSGMYLQVDVIPSSKNYFTANMEDGLVLADRSLQADLKAQYPDCYARCQKRREFVAATLGLELPDEVLPLSNIQALVPPYLLNPNMVFALG